MTGPRREATGIPADAGAAVDLALVLSVDCSSSIKPADFRLQMDGIAAALRHPQVAEAVAAGRRRSIALCLVQWAQAQAVAVPWRLLADATDLERAAREIAGTERKWPLGGTALAAGIDYCADVLGRLPVAADRRVIDVSGDGPDNVSGDAADARDRAVARGITVNGLPILNGWRQLLIYYQTQVIGGRNAFVEPAEDMAAFHDTILRKLLREIGAQIA